MHLGLSEASSFSSVSFFVAIEESYIMMKGKEKEHNSSPAKNEHIQLNALKEQL